MIDYFNRVEQRTPLFAFPQLTEPKTQALKLIALYRTDPEITHLLHLNPKTVRSYTSNIFAKMQVVDHAKAGMGE